jgi:hypothetical protein
VWQVEGVVTRETIAAAPAFPNELYDKGLAHGTEAGDTGMMGFDRVD